MSKTATRTFIIPPKSIICGIQPVIIEEQPKPDKDDDNLLLEQVNITESDINSTQLQVGKQLIVRYSDIFQKSPRCREHSSKHIRE